MQSAAFDEQHKRLTISVRSTRPDIAILVVPEVKCGASQKQTSDGKLIQKYSSVSSGYGHASLVVMYVYVT